MTDTEVRGDCSVVAFTMGTSPDALPRSKVVHGHPIGRGGEAEGLRYWHAWVEVTTPAGTVVVDYSNGLEVVMPRTRYYRLGQIRDVRRYTPDQARAMAAEWGHLGPWDGTEPAVEPEP